jgi:hypothetical protein
MGLGLNPVSSVGVLGISMIFGNDLQFIDENLVGTKALFIDQEQSVILSQIKITS